MSKPEGQGGSKAAASSATKAARALQLGKGMSVGAKLGAGIVTLVTGTAGFGVYQFTKSAPDPASETAAADSTSTATGDEAAKLIPTDVGDKSSTRLMSSLENAPPPSWSSPGKDRADAQPTDPQPADTARGENPWAKKDANAPPRETTNFGASDPSPGARRPNDAAAPSPWSRSPAAATPLDNGGPVSKADAASPPALLPEVKPAVRPALPPTATPITKAPISNALRSSPDRAPLMETKPVGSDRILSSDATTDSAKNISSPSAVKVATLPKNPCVPIAVQYPCPPNPCPPNPCGPTDGNSSSPRTFAPSAAPKTSNGRAQVPTLARELRSAERPADTDVPVQNAAFNLPTPALARPEGMPVSLTEKDTYVVLPDDSYWTIAEAVYGNGDLYRALAEHNRRKFPGRRLAVGDEISTPSELVLRRLYPWLCPSPL